MVYFIGHCILLNDTWIPLTNIPVDLVDLGQDQSNRFLDRKELSLQLLWQNKRHMQPLYNTIVKTTFIKIFQRSFREKLDERRKKTLPKFILGREIGIYN